MDMKNLTDWLLRALSKNKEGRPEVVVHRTAEGTIMEILCAVLIVVLWVLVLVHFAWTNVIGASLGTLACTLMLFSAYHPRETVNMPVSITNEKQYAVITRMVRLVAIEFAILFICINLDTSGHLDNTFINNLIIFIPFIMIILTVAICTIMVWIMK